MYAASSDGTLAVFNFDPEELEGIAPHSVQEQYLQKFGFVPPPLPEGFSHPLPVSAPSATSSRITPPPSPSRTKSATPNGFGGANGINGGGEVINKLVAKRGNKKRIQPNFMGSLGGSVPSASNSAVNQTAAPAAGPSNGMSSSRAFGTGPSGTQLQPIAHPTAKPPSHSISPITDNWPHGGYDADIDMGGPVDMEVPISSLSTGDGPSLKGKRKASTFDLADDVRGKSRTLGGDRPRDSVVVREIGPGASGSGPWAGAALSGLSLPIPPLYNSLTVKVEGSDDSLEARNSEEDGTY